MQPYHRLVLAVSGQSSHEGGQKCRSQIASGGGEWRVDSDEPHHEPSTVLRQSPIMSIGEGGKLLLLFPTYHLLFPTYPAAQDALEGPIYSRQNCAEEEGSWANRMNSRSLCSATVCSIPKIFFRWGEGGEDPVHVSRDRTSITIKEAGLVLSYSQTLS